MCPLKSAGSPIPWQEVGGDVKFSLGKDKQARPIVSPAGLNTCPYPSGPGATNYRPPLAERFNTRFREGPLLGRNPPLVRPTVAELYGTNDDE